MLGGRRDNVATIEATGLSLSVEDLCAGYGTEVLHQVSVSVAPGEIVSVLGANGAGKSTLAKAIMGAVRPTRGRVVLDSDDVTGRPVRDITARGVAMVPEGRRVFARRTIVDNLLIAAWVRRRDRNGVADDVAELLTRFPILGQRRKEFAGSLSGGEAQLLAIAMALVARPRLVILDEPSLGLSPIAVGRMADEIRSLAESGKSILLIEQNARTALAISARAYVLELGKVQVSGTPAELKANDAVRSAYLQM